FLIVIFYVFWQITMDYHPHIRLIDSHSKSISTHHHTDFIFHPRLLALRSNLHRKPGMIGQCRNPELAESISDLMRSLTISHIPDRRTIDSTENFQSFFELVFYKSYAIAKVFSGETLTKFRRLFHLKPLNNISANLRSSRSSQCQNGDIRVIRTNQSDLQIWRTKIISPLRDAMRF